MLQLKLDIEIVDLMGLEKKVARITDELVYYSNKNE